MSSWPQNSGYYSSLGNELAPTKHDAALALLQEYVNLFSTIPQNLGLMKGTQHQLKLEDARPFRAQTYRKSKVKEARVENNPASC